MRSPVENVRVTLYLKAVMHSQTVSNLQIYDARNAMKNVCRLPNPECSAIDMIKKFLRIGLQSKDKPDLLDSLNRAILLISRSQDYLWNHNNLIRPLLELLGKTCQDDEDESQTLLCWAIEAIGLVRFFVLKRPPFVCADEIFFGFRPLDVIRQWHGSIWSTFLRLSSNYWTRPS